MNLQSPTFSFPSRQQRPASFLPVLQGMACCRHLNQAKPVWDVWPNSAPTCRPTIDLIQSRGIPRKAHIYPSS